MTFDRIGSKNARASIDTPVSPGDQLARRSSSFLDSVKGKLASQGKWGRRVINLLNLGCEVKPLDGRKTFLSQASRRSFNAVSTMRALVQDTVDPPPLLVPDKFQASRLRRNLAKHDELRRALRAVRIEVGDVSNKDQKLKNFAKVLDDLHQKLEMTCSEVSKISGKTDKLERHASKTTQRTLEGALRKAWLAAADETSRSTPEESILAQLSLIDGKSPPSIEPSRSVPAEVRDMLGKALVMSGAEDDSADRVASLVECFNRADAQSRKIFVHALTYCVTHPDDTLAKGLAGSTLALLANVPKKIDDANPIKTIFESEVASPRAPRQGDGYGAVKRRFQSTGLVDPKVAENLTRDAFQRQGKRITEEELQEFVADFTSAATGRRDYVLNRLLDARDKEVGLDRLMQIVKGTRLWTFTDLPAIPNGDLATYAIHDIARSFTPTLQGEDFKRAVSDALLRSSLTSEQAAAFMQHAKDLPLAGRSRIVRDTIAEYAEKL
jgi:tetrahydromethanopterin S-methyltransferase subunit G